MVKWSVKTSIKGLINKKVDIEFQVFSLPSMSFYGSDHAWVILSLPFVESTMVEFREMIFIAPMPLYILPLSLLFMIYCGLFAMLFRECLIPMLSHFPMDFVWNIFQNQTKISIKMRLYYLSSKSKIQIMFIDTRILYFEFRSSNEIFWRRNFSIIYFIA